MQYTVDYLPDKKIVAVKITGRLNFQAAEQSSKEALKLAHQNNCTKFLLDHTETTKQGGLNNLHTSGAELQQFGFKNTDHIAIVISNLAYTSYLPEPVSQSSHWSVLKYFNANNTEEASNWLMEIE